MLVRPRCAQCTNTARWKLHLYLHKSGEGKQVCFCGTHVKPFRAQRTTLEWTVTATVRLVYS
jgi:hypothetical protein